MGSVRCRVYCKLKSDLQRVMMSVHTAWFLAPTNHIDANQSWPRSGIWGVSPGLQRCKISAVIQTPSTPLGTDNNGDVDTCFCHINPSRTTKCRISSLEKSLFLGPAASVRVPTPCDLGNVRLLSFVCRQVVAYGSICRESFCRILLSYDWEYFFQDNKV